MVHLYLKNIHVMHVKLWDNYQSNQSLVDCLLYLKLYIILFNSI